MMYINSLSPEYYLMLEDDVIARKNYDRDIIKVLIIFIILYINIIQNWIQLKTLLT